MAEEVERRLPPIFPSKKTLFSGRHLSVPELVAIEGLVGTKGPLAGYLVAEGPRDALFLLFLKGKPYSAGVFREGTMEPMAVREFFSRLLKTEKTERTFDFVAVDSAVLLLIAVHFQKRPMLSISTDLASPEEILGKVEENGRDAIIALVDGALRHVVFCQRGRPVRFYSAGDVTVPEEDSLEEVITIFCFERGGKRPVTLEIYDDLAVSPAPDHGLPLGRYTAMGGNAPRFELTIFEGSQQVDSFIFQNDRCIIGRGETADLQLKDHAVSREHAMVAFEKGRMVLHDLDSDNGTWINNLQLTDRHYLKRGDEVRVGRLRLVYKPLPQGLGSSDETLHLDPSQLGARVVYEGESFPVLDSGLVLGKGASADISLRGFFLKKRQARLYRDNDGQYWIEHLGGMRKPSVNGEVVLRGMLKTGDAIRLGGSSLRFYDSD